MADSSEVLASLEDHQACDLAILDQKIETKYFKNVYEFLAKFSTLWFHIGLLIGVPIERLHEIDLDYHTTKRKLAEMINAWINNCKNCTWRVLCEALQHVREEPKKVAWDEKQAVLSSREAGFTILQSVTKKSFENYTIYLRCLLKVPHTISDLYLFRRCDRNLVFNFMTYIDRVSEITKTFQYNKKCFQVWDNFLITETNSVCDKLSTLAKQKEEIKKKLFLQEAEKEKLYKSNSFDNPYFSIASTDQAQHIKQDMEAADDYRETLCHCLNSCLESVNVAINRNSNIKFTGTLTKTYLKRLLFTSILIVGLISFPLLTCLQNPVIVIVICLPTGCAYGAILVVGTTKSKWVRYIAAYVVNIIHRYYIIVGTLLRVCVGFMNLLLMSIPNFLQEQSEPNHQQAQSTLNIQQVMTSPIFFMSFILGAMLTSAIWHHSNQSSKITGILSFIMILFYWQSLSMTFFLAGMFWSIIYAMSGRFIKFHLILTAMGFLHGVTIQAAAGIGSRLFGTCGGHLMQSIGVGIGYGIVAPCSLMYASSINIPFIDDSMPESMECFNENIKDLELIKKGTNDALHKALTLKHRLIGT